MFRYKDSVTLNQKFNKSVNIIYDVEDCSQYILTTSAQNVLKSLFKQKSNNSISLIGPFGCGKSSLLLYINTLLSESSHKQKCLEKIHAVNQELYNQIIAYNEKRRFFRVKLVGEHISFKTYLRMSLLSFKELKKTIKYLKANEHFQVSKVLNILADEIKSLGYTDVLFTIDEFGKFIEYSLEDKTSNDIFELQTVSEFINTQENWKLLVSLHKTFREYTSMDDISISFSDWDKIQGRFENIVFNDDFFEMLNIFKETISLDEKVNQIQEAQNIVGKVCSDNSFTKQVSTNDTLNMFKHICPIHPYSVLVIAEIFTKYFQNQRSIYSFLFSSEAYAFQEFLNREHKYVELYDLTNLYDYVMYLLKIYTISLPDKELWYLAEYRLKDKRIQNSVQRDIIKTIGLLHSFKLNLTVSPNIEHIILSLLDKYKEQEIKENIHFLENSNIIVFQSQTKSYSLLEDSNIDINKEMKNLLSQDLNIDYENKINELLGQKEIVAKRFFSKYGLEKSFKEEYILNESSKLNEPYRIFLLPELNAVSKKQALKNSNSLFILIKSYKKLEEHIKKIEGLRYIKERNASNISRETCDIIDNMILDYIHSFEAILQHDIEESKILYKDKEYLYSSKTLQALISDVVEKNFYKTPIINNYTLNYTINSMGTNTSILKSLFKRMMDNYAEPNLGFEKFPAERALYLSVVKPSGIHRKVDGVYQLTEPNDLNFEFIWKEIKSFIKNRVNVVDIIHHLSKKPFGLNKMKALFVLSLFILVHKDKVNVFRENTYVLSLSIEKLMNMWKAAKKFELEFIELSKKEEHLFKAYLTVINQFTEKEYSKENVTSIIKTLYNKFNAMPAYAHQTEKLSGEAIALRSALTSVREPSKAFFQSFPSALGYDDINNINISNFIEKFKATFNEIALSYKKEILELEEYIANNLFLVNKNFPFDNALSKMADKLSNIETLDNNSKAIVQCFTYSNSIIDFVDSLSMILIRKKIEQCYDSDIVILKERIKEYSEKLISKLELNDIVQKNQEVRRLSLVSLEQSLSKVIAIDKNEIGRINKKAEEIKQMIPTDYTGDQKLYLITQLLNKELDNE